MLPIRLSMWTQLVRLFTSNLESLRFADCIAWSIIWFIKHLSIDFWGVLSKAFLLHAGLLLRPLHIMLHALFNYMNFCYSYFSSVCFIRKKVFSSIWKYCWDVNCISCGNYLPSSQQSQFLPGTLPVHLWRFKNLKSYDSIYTPTPRT